MFSVGWHTIVQSCNDNHKEVTTNQKKQYSQDSPRVDNDDENTRTTWHEECHWEIVHEPSRTADSSNNECLSHMWKALATHIFTWLYGGDYYTGQQASGLLAPVFSRYAGQSAKDHYPIQSHGLHQHIQVLRKDYSQLQLRTPPPPNKKITCPKMHASG